MSIVATPMTTEEFLSLPDDTKFSRWLIEGELRERPMSLRNPKHSAAMAAIARHLGNYAAEFSGHALRVYAGDVYYRLSRNPDTNVGADVAVSLAAQIAATPENSRLIEGAPLLAVEILSPSDMIEDIDEKTNEYLKNGTRVVWIVDPFQDSVTVRRPGHEPVLFSRSQELSGDPELPGFSVSVADLFG